MVLRPYVQTLEATYASAVAWKMPLSVNLLVVRDREKATGQQTEARRSK